MRRFASDGGQLRAMVSRPSTFGKAITFPILRRVRKHALRPLAGPAARRAWRLLARPWRIGNAGSHRQRRQVEEVGKPFAVFLRRIEFSEFDEVDRKAGLAMHEADGIALVMREHRDGLVLRDADPDAAGEPADGPRQHDRLAVERGQIFRAVAGAAPVQSASGKAAGRSEERPARTGRTLSRSVQRLLYRSMPGYCYLARLGLLL